MFNKKVLHFDDEPFLSRAVGESLNLLDEWDVTLVAEIDELFRELQNNQYDAVIMDIMAPIPPLENEHVKFTQKEIEEMDGGINTGVVLAKKIMYTTQYKDIPILFLTARSLSYIIDDPDFANNNKCGFIRKPALASDICNALQDLLNV